ncbi:DUF4859 domain-containing protein [Sphingobacterium pedocola]|uniref:DUF4859 domain-containing protein n=1 Tax=Sphingobacterium pedocola TaxID=2082722 RepID=A0ABR9TAP1_9SPHI|nr:DUF4859 domain-containing protein [Sphingobacterium pedocola]MBE8722398.1 DUF4859 domain-containing protein [Sphingobacterium pedocola]
MKTLLLKGIMLLFFPVILLNTGCNKKLLDELAAQQIAPLPGEEVSFEDDSLEIYIPKEFEDMNFYNNASTWSYDRSKESAHFIVFWGAGYGRNDPNSASVQETYRVDIDDLLAKAEQFYDVNIKTLKFAERGVGKSNLDKYKMMIFLHYTTEWMAFGGGYDDVIGALWINPATCKPVGSTIAHEIGHSFQYQVRCDLGANHGLRYGFGGNGGNAFWEQTAQWQAHQTYPMEAFSSYNFTVYTENYHRHIHHEWYRYASYFIHDYWASKHGIDIVGRVWRAATAPEDPVQAYMRVTGVDVNQFNDEIFEAATKFVTWDIDALRSNGANYIGKQTNSFRKQESGAFRVSYNRCPGTTGYNVVPLNLAPSGTILTTHFKGLPNATGFNPVDASRAGWRYGYVALLENGTRVYGTMNRTAEGDASFTVPANCKNLWFVVSGAPTVYTPHAWDEDEANDEQWPYELSFTNTGILGYVDAGSQPQNVSFVSNLSLPLGNDNYAVTPVVIDQAKFAELFAVRVTELNALLESGKIKFYAVEENGTLNATRTANGYGQWLDNKGNVTTWGTNSFFFSEFDQNGLIFNIGQFPGAASAGSYVLKQALVYEYEPGKTVQATFVFNIKIE